MKIIRKLRSELAVILIFIFLLTNIFFIANAASESKNISNQIQTNSENCNFKSYYYNQLNDIEKAIYDKLFDARQNFLKGEEIVFPILSDNTNKKRDYLYYIVFIRRICKAFTYDNPEVEIWFDVYKREFFRKQGYIYIRLIPKNQAEENINLNGNNMTQAVSNFEQKVDEFVKTLSGSEREKLQQIHDWLIANVEYDDTLQEPNTKTAYGAIVEGRSVCSGFAYAFKYIANVANLNVLYVTGKYYNILTDTFISHAWNIVYLDGEYLLIDASLDSNLSDDEPQYTFFLSAINDQKHYVDKYYFCYPF